MSNAIDTVEHFYGVYLLYCTNPKYTGRVYIGYTVDPNRRIQQHNKGKHAGGAWKTSSKGPWVMVMIIHGFPNDIAALRFEWAWQHPQSSRRLQHVQKKKAREKTYDFSLRILSEMLRVGPWDRLPLTIRWLNHEFARNFPEGKSPPMHMPICYGPVISKKVQKGNGNEKVLDDEEILHICSVCHKEITDRMLTCLNGACMLKSHVICLSKHYLNKGEYVPIEGTCPECHKTYLWGDIVRKFKGCYNNLDIQVKVDDASEFCNSDSD